MLRDSSDFTSVSISIHWPHSCYVESVWLVHVKDLHMFSSRQASEWNNVAPEKDI